LVCQTTKAGELELCRFHLLLFTAPALSANPGEISAAL